MSILQLIASLRHFFGKSPCFWQIIGKQSQKKAKNEVREARSLLHTPRLHTKPNVHKKFGGSVRCSIALQLAYIKTSNRSLLAQFFSAVQSSWPIGLAIKKEQKGGQQSKKICFSNFKFKNSSYWIALNAEESLRERFRCLEKRTKRV